jgi:hypothetical protein
MRLIYFIYFILKSDYKSVFKGIECAKKYKHPLSLFLDALFCSLKYGTSLDDYFSFRFYNKTKTQRKAYATTAYMYVFHKSMNDKHIKQKIDDKSQFRKYFKNFSGVSELFDSNNKQQFIKWLVESNINQLVIKDPLGTIGKTINFFSYNPQKISFTNKNTSYSLDELFKQFSIRGKLYVEPRIIQHQLIQKLAPTALNTIRVITVVDKSKQVDIISAAFRISVNSETDNFSTGNLAATIDVSTGVVVTPGIKRMAACSDSYEEHPITGEKILGFKIPFWDEVMKIVKQAALVFPEVRTVGWDVAILNDKPIIIEGNPSWNKGAPQIPLDAGIKPILNTYL